ncbi:aminotransferase class I/II-fold pyridoxal phosphate-dependent enzyme [Lacticaseibacillus yichunensis]|uniref:Aminotransferase n=1 Tax=Lacticaseibacillus yichunensis TaxID=2486015 RepID=A0ABW4CMN5_9LACO|nr:aminotransferase class I/II-fold pyridoxal phosphate-dependent enzyme [Lacticaseibacillus yichunensis]
MTNVETMLHRVRPDLLAMKPSALRAFDEEVSAIPGIIKLTLGEPDFNTPEHIKQAGIRSIEQNHTHYPQAAGIPALREAAAGFLNEKYRLHYTPEEIIVTVGATEAIWASLGALIQPGDKVIVPIPAWGLYMNVIELLGATPVFIDTEPDGYELNPEKLRAVLDENGDSVRALVLNFPNNPTGKTLRRPKLQAIANVLKDYPVFAIADEVYSELTFGEPHVSLAELLPEQTLLLNGVSKSHAMTGWRIGVIAGAQPIIDQVFKFHQASVTSAAYPMEDAAVEAFTAGKDDGREMAQDYEKRGRFLYQALVDLGFDVVEPEGAFYLYCKVPAWLNEDDATFCRRLAYEAQVAVSAGTAFGPSGKNHFRISYASSLADLKEAARRIGVYLDKRRAE